MSFASSSSNITTVVGTCHPAAASSNAQANTITGTRAPLPPNYPIAIQSPTSARTRPPSPQSSDPIDDFFGSTTTHGSRHDARLSITAPPSYAEGGPALPSYTESQSGTPPKTLARVLFLYGFLFPPFWVLGAIILCSPLRAPEPSPESGEKPLADAYVQIVRTEECRWARRCVAALAGLTLLIVAIVIACLAVLKWT
ncbi:hypothetical protein PLICRDRAFT_179376 [Plicaturopsis crispa FD-325 SS-3]|uniref:Unplaced genomic scaffold PLICRscaffold_17, whole genome shotgun sequence n=1 Tax=Plicaturopsis crispa FD-325 SS-3 TaxID=944288 RepID=A0A0C9T5C5_PLICR|nr:hypothetical protein PLICRDRAFT_179376 [Plicaturopsis crispa FD-325 SS-3]